MKLEEFERLVQASGLNLLSAHPPRFLVSLYVERKHGTRIQTGKIEFLTVEAFESCTKEQAQSAINIIKERLLQSAQTQQGNIAQGGTVKIESAQEGDQQKGINYPAH